jgi:glycosyltransferase involved in cell wall biosynthesis
LTRAASHIRTIFLIRHLDFGGAERQLLNLVKALDKEVFDVWLITFYDDGGLSSELASIPGVHHLSLHKASRWDVLGFAFRLWKVMRRVRPAIVHGYMAPANLAALVAGKLVAARVIWGIRASNMDLRQYDWLPRVLFRLECLLSRFPDLVIANSCAGKRYYVANGFPWAKIRVIHNGVDIDRFKPDLDARQRLRAEWRVTPEQLLVGMVARLDPMKGHALFLHAAAKLLKTRRDLLFLCVGDGPDSYRVDLEHLARELGISSHLRWVRAGQDMPALYNGFDLVCSTSTFGEGFSNVLAEAMACGVPCVSTPTGDAATLLGSVGRVVESYRPDDFAQACTFMLQAVLEDRTSLSQAARARILEHFTLQELAQRTEDAVRPLAF